LKTTLGEGFVPLADTAHPFALLLLLTTAMKGFTSGSETSFIDGVGREPREE
jgi:hypothetical protein